MATISAKWLRLASSACLQRSSQALAVVGSKAWIFGGELQPRQPVDNQLDVVDLGYSTVPAPSARVGTAMVAVGNDAYIFSGRGGLDMNAIDEAGALWSLSTSTGAWSLVAPQDGSPRPEPRSYHAMASDGDKSIYLHAGCPAAGRLADLWRFDMATRLWKELPSAPGPARGGTSIAFAEGKLYRMGGFDGKTEQGGSLDIFDIATQTWSSKAFPPDGVNGPEARSVAALVFVRAADGRRLLVTLFGERDPSSLGHAGAGKMLANVWAFDLDAETWIEVKPTASDDGVPPARGWFAADVLRRSDGDAVLVHGGLAEDNSRLGDVWQLQF
ncbi:kelch repeat protein [Purpureocillium lavendulum]|uniref:Kelch repeat protein n=1 Tax=Purpureocillium lavendulum TaxID=1247861 RepID=A0AB34FP17_9HYPO|nr:kelch repeat protein [Purpureocillium lavendulum]